MIQGLDREDRLRLMRFVCAFAWADLEVADAERDFVGRLAEELGFDDEDRKEIKGWLSHPPDPEDLDPFEIPHEHKKLFLDTILGMVGADGKINVNELTNFSLLQQLLE